MRDKPAHFKATMRACHAGADWLAGQALVRKKANKIILPKLYFTRSSLALGVVGADVPTRDDKTQAVTLGVVLVQTSLRAMTKPKPSPCAKSQGPHGLCDFASLCAE